MCVWHLALTTFTVVVRCRKTIYQKTRTKNQTKVRFVVVVAVVVASGAAAVDVLSGS